MKAAIYRKDVKLYGIEMLKVIPIVIAFHFFVKLVLNPWGYLLDDGDYATTAMSISVFMALTFAILVGMGFVSEERTGGTNILLKRLPISSRKIYFEKLLAGLTIVLTLNAFILAYYYLIDANDYSLWKSPNGLVLGGFKINLLYTMVTGYFFCVALSFIAKEPIVIFVGALVAETLMWLALATMNDPNGINWLGFWTLVLYVVPLIVVPIVFSRFNWRLTGLQTDWQRIRVNRRGLASCDVTRFSSQRMTALARRYFAENGFLQVLALGSLVAAVIHSFSVASEPLSGHGEDFFFAGAGGSAIPISGIGLLVLAALGARANSNSEGQSTSNILHRQPAPREEIFWAKIVAAIPAITLVATSLIIIWWGRIPWVSSAFFCILVFSCALHTSMWENKQVPIILATLISCLTQFLYTMAWMTGISKSKVGVGIQVENDPFLVGLIPLSVMLIGSLYTAYDMATNHHFLSGTNKFRLKYNFTGTTATILTTLVVCFLAPTFVSL